MSQANQPAADFLFELGCEELPAGPLVKLATTLSTQIEHALTDAKLNFAAVNWYATPRRLSVMVKQLDLQQPDQTIERKGPAKQAAFDADGNPSKAAEGFARSCGVAVSDLEERDTPKGTWLYYCGSSTGQAAAELLPKIVQTALDKLPIPKRMRWGASDAQFLRPVRWAVALLGSDTLAFDVYGQTTGNTTYGHRFHAPQAITLTEPADYLTALRDAQVEPDFAVRRQAIEQQIQVKATEIGGTPLVDQDLLDEVTGLVELPVVVAGNFDEDFLALPDEVLIVTLQEHQRYFTVKGSDGKLLPWFITISNLDSTDLSVVASGNERVVRPRLADAMFFWQNDAKQTLADRIPKLAEVVFQRDLGSMQDKANRVSQLAAQVSGMMSGSDPKLAQRAAQLARCDLVTEVVYEIPEVQGTIGRYYAERDGEPAEVAMAIEEQYLPRFAGDELPQTSTGQALSIAEKLDTIAGIFAIGKKPTGDKDPFALRRAALGVLRIMSAGAGDFDLDSLIQAAIAAQPVTARKASHNKNNKNTDNDLFTDIQAFFIDRLRAWQLDEGMRPDVFAAVAAVAPGTPKDFIARMAAVTEFLAIPEAETLAAANKRTQNILKKNPQTDTAVDPALLSVAEEQDLHTALTRLQTTVTQHANQGEYNQALTLLAELKQPVDAFFDHVMVMADDEATKNNRLALLTELKNLFTQVADISELQIEKAAS